MTLEHATHTTYKITRFDSEEWLNYNKKERSKPLKNEPNCLKPDYRIERAKEKLGEKETNIREVGQTVGYADPNYFAKVFRRVTGMSPTEYQSRMD